MENEWKLIGFDTFAEEDYPIGANYSSEEKARDAATSYFKKLDEEQPPESSGGQGELGIQDRIFVQRPDGSRFRFIPLAEELRDTHKKSPPSA